MYISTPMYLCHLDLGYAGFTFCPSGRPFEVGYGSGKRHSMLIRAMVSTSDSVRPKPYGFGARRRAYSPSMELRKGRISSV